MVQIYPKSYKEVFSKSYAEKKLYQKLASLNDNWYVWHSKEWSLNKFGEADFIVFNNIYGYIVLEVKGGKIELEHNQYYTTPLNGKKRRIKIRDPFSQARVSMFAIKDLYMDEAKKQKNSYQLISSIKNQKGKESFQFPGNFTFGVVFWDCFFKEECKILKPTNVNTEKIYDASDVRSNVKISDFLIKLFQNLKIRHLPDPVKSFFPKFISGNIKTKISLYSRLEYFNSQLERINIEQDKYLAILGRNPQAIIQGSAGTGKTYIAMKKIINQYKKGDNCLFLCYNREIRNFVWMYLKNTYFPNSNMPTNISIENIHTILYKISEKGNSKENHKKFMVLMQDFHNNQIQKLITNRILEIINSTNFKFNTIIIDEGQDFPSNFVKIIKKLLNRTDSSIFYIFYDDAQKIFDSNFNIDDFNFENPIKIDLPQNLRNVDSVINWFSKLTGLGNYPFLSGLEGMPIEEKNNENYHECLNDAIRDVYSLIISLKISQEKIIILGEKKLQSLFEKNIIQKIKYHDEYGNISFYSKIFRFPNRKTITIIEPEKNSGFHSICNQIKDNCILYNSIGTFKGLERDFIFLIIPNLKTIKKSNIQIYNKIKKRIYVGASRARFQLFVYQYENL